MLRGLAPLAVLLLLFGACLGSKGVRDGCACGPERNAGTGPADVPTSEIEEDRPSVDELAPAGPAAPPAGTAPTGLPDLADPSWTRVTSRAGKYVVCWRSRTGSVPRNQDFELEAWVLRDGKPVRDALLTVSAWMPDHGHGMLRQPRAEVRDDGSFRIEGMLLHMRGHWQLFFEVLEGSLSETAECRIDL